MLAERGERLDESVDYMKQALEIEPNNGSYLDSLGWAYYKDDKLDLAEDNLNARPTRWRRIRSFRITTATCSSSWVAYEEAIEAWNRALRRRRRFDRSRRHRQEDPVAPAEARQEMIAAIGGAVSLRFAGVRGVRGAASKLPSGPGTPAADAAERSRRRRPPAAS